MSDNEVSENGFTSPISAWGGSVTPVPLTDDAPHPGFGERLGSALSRHARRSTFRANRLSSLKLALGFDAYRGR